MSVKERLIEIVNDLTEEETIEFLLILAENLKKKEAAHE